MLLTFDLDGTLVNRFRTALSISGEEEAAVVERLIRSYSSAVFSAEAARLSGERPAPSGALRRGAPEAAAPAGEASSRAARRIPLWATRPNQLCSQILRAFFAAEAHGTASRSRMADLYGEATRRSRGNFEQNLGNMCTEGGNAYGKVFVCQGDEVRLWGPVEHLARQYRSAFLSP